VSHFIYHKWVNVKSTLEKTDWAMKNWNRTKTNKT